MPKCIKCSTELPDGALFCLACGKKQTSERKHKKRANGTGNITKLSGNRSKPWLARRNGVSIGTYATRTEAQKALERVTDAVITEKYNMTFKQVFEAWKEIHWRNISQSQQNCYTMAYNSSADLYDLAFRKLRKSDFQRQIIRLEEAGKSKSSCEKLKQLYSQLSKWALSEDIIQTNHAQNLGTVAKQLSSKQVFLQADIEAIRASGSRGKDIVLILLACGCRPNELFNVPLVNCHDSYFIGGSKTKAGTDRLIPISPDGLDAYRALRQNAIEKKGSRLIDGFDGNKILNNFAKREFKELMDEIGRSDMSMYNCRHTFITNAVRSGVDQRVLQQIIGHVDSETTKLYTHLNIEDILAQAGKIKTFAVCNKSATSNNPKKYLSTKSS